MKRAFFLFFWILLGKAQRGIMIFTSLVVVTLILVQVGPPLLLQAPAHGSRGHWLPMVGFWMYFIVRPTVPGKEPHQGRHPPGLHHEPENPLHVKGARQPRRHGPACIMVQWAIRYFSGRSRAGSAPRLYMIPMVLRAVQPRGSAPY